MSGSYLIGLGSADALPSQLCRSCSTFSPLLQSSHSPPQPPNHILPPTSPMSPPDAPPRPARLGPHATPAERQAHALAKLLANPEREIVIPERAPDGVGWSIRAPRETMRNVQGSSAGAGQWTEASPRDGRLAG